MVDILCLKESVICKTENRLVTSLLKLIFCGLSPSDKIGAI